MKYLLLILATLTITPVLGCDCELLGEINDEQFYSYELIVVGQVKRVIEGDQVNTIYLRVKQVYKGVPQKRTIAITTPKDPFRCGLVPKKGEAWLMFARKFEGQLMTNQCTRSKSLSRKARFYYSSKGVLEGDLAFLEAKIGRS